MFISDSGIPLPPLDLDSPVNFDDPSPPSGTYSWAATVQAELGEPKPMTQAEITQR